MNEILSDPASAEAPSRRGRKASGASRSDIEKAASEKHRKKQLDGGKCEVKAFVNLDTKAMLAQLKNELDLSTIGEVIDALTQQFKKSKEKS